MKTNNLKLSYNFNNKLDCDVFTVIHPFDPKLFQKGNLLELYLKSEQVGKVNVLEHRELSEEKINDWIAYIDTGYNAARTKIILRCEFPTTKKQQIYSWALLSYTRRYNAVEYLRNEDRPKKNAQLSLGLLAPSNSVKKPSVGLVRA